MSELIQSRFVVGMSWASIVAKGEMAKLAQKRAIKDKANWYAHNGKETNVGMAKLNKSIKPKKGEKLISAARLAAAYNSFGHCFYAIQMPDDSNFAGKVWVCGVSNGVPVNLFDVISEPHEISSRVEAFAVSRGVSIDDIEAYGDIDGVSQEIKALSWPELVRVPGNVDFALVKPTVVPFLDQLSPAKKVLGAAGILIIGGSYAWGEYDKYKAKKARELAAMTAADPTVEWNNSVRTWSDTKSGPTGEPIDVLRRGLATVPLEVAGWELKTIECTLAKPLWTCVGLFDRKPNVIKDPTTKAFISERPQHWIVNPKNLDTIEAIFKLPVDVKSLDYTKVKNMAWHQENTTNLLQKGFRAFTTVALTDFTAVSLVSPLTAEGAPIDMPADFVKPMSAGITLTGPMRSLDLEEIRELPVSWIAASLIISKALEKPSLTASSVTITMKGEVYAKSQ